MLIADYFSGFQGGKVVKEMGKKKMEVSAFNAIKNDRRLNCS